MLTKPIIQSSTRREILLLLKKRGALTVQEMSELLGITGMAVRRHLIVLQKQHYIRIVLQRLNGRKPTSIYSLSNEAEGVFPDQYDTLALELLENLHDMKGDLYIEMLFAKKTEKLEQRYRRLLQGYDLEKRIRRLAQIQDSEGYMVKLEKSGEGEFLLEEANCPVSQIAAHYPQVCRCELALFSDVLDAHVERMECMAEGGGKCRYLIRERGSRQ
ncbi:ArsR family transcriptional regulator [Paenibacillus sp.]|jgi:predicted ArsR family transcriptional regulator|uniref:helix-turn-helix transcriptional regulator n=1 Tax=Paenibacillus sp. TaxID=58172 RepID=UPI0028297500|nr:ArsR family transcriptional regulator [Paenibacillus sp.]MDR0269518.1 ArsR family transcriptional regulator [Paenibacillus sp.]